MHSVLLDNMRNDVVVEACLAGLVASLVVLTEVTRQTFNISIAESNFSFCQVNQNSLSGNNFLVRTNKEMCSIQTWKTQGYV